MAKRNDGPRIVFVGQAPARTSNGDEPLTGRFGRRLAELLGMGYDSYLSTFERRNVFDRWPGKSGKGDAFPAAKAAGSARRMSGDLGGAVVVLFGRQVGRAFGLCSDYFEWADAGGFAAVVVPHPSGVNRWWNCKVNRERAGRFFGALLEGAGLSRLSDVRWPAG